MSHPRKPRPSRWPALSTASPLATERLPALYAGLRWVVAPILRRLFDFQVSGHEHLPAQGPFIVAANHESQIANITVLRWFQAFQK